MLFSFCPRPLLSSEKEACDLRLGSDLSFPPVLLSRRALKLAKRTLQSVEPRLELGVFLLLLFDLCLLFLDGVDEDGGKLIVLDALDLAFVVAEREQRFDLLNFFRAQANVSDTALLPGEGDRTQTIDDVQSAGEARDVFLVPQSRCA